jgi:hypothetical protein
VGIARKIGEVVAEHARRAFKGEGGYVNLYNLKAKTSGVATFARGRIENLLPM